MGGGPREGALGGCGDPSHWRLWAHRGKPSPPSRSPAPLPSLEPHELILRCGPQSHLFIPGCERDRGWSWRSQGLAAILGKLFWGSTGVNPANVIPFSPHSILCIVCGLALPPAWLIPPESCCLWDEIRECTLHAQVYNHLPTLDPKRAGCHGQRGYGAQVRKGAGRSKSRGTPRGLYSSETISKTHGPPRS